MSIVRPAVGPRRSGTEPPPLPEAVEARRERRLAGGLGLLGLAVFVVAAILNPYDDAGRPRTHGTHRQLGLPPCTLKSLTGLGCPSCGMTTAFSLLAHGDPAAAWRINWAGCVAALLAATGTTWFVLVAAGLPSGRFTSDEVVKFMVAIGTAVAVARWLAVLCGGGLSAAV